MRIKSCSIGNGQPRISDDGDWKISNLNSSVLINDILN